MSETPGDIRIPPPSLGEHTNQILEDYLNFTKSEIQDLRQKNII